MKGRTEGLKIVSYYYRIDHPRIQFIIPVADDRSGAEFGYQFIL